jgi:hypothetical protein
LTQPNGEAPIEAQPRRTRLAYEYSLMTKIGDQVQVLRLDDWATWTRRLCYGMLPECGIRLKEFMATTPFTSPKLGLLQGFANIHRVRDEHFWLYGIASDFIFADYSLIRFERVDRDASATTMYTATVTPIVLGIALIVRGSSVSRESVSVS